MLGGRRQKEPECATGKRVNFYAATGFAQFRPPQRDRGAGQQRLPGIGPASCAGERNSSRSLRRLAPALLHATLPIPATDSGPVCASDYNAGIMTLVEQIQKDLTEAMKAREEQRLSTLRMVKTALKNREIEKMAPLDDKESQAVLSTLIKQRKEAMEQFAKGGRQEMADKEAAEIQLIETYLPKAAGDAEIVAGVKAVIAEMGSPTMKDMGAVMKNVMARFAGAGMRVDGKLVSDTVKQQLAGK